VLLVLAARCAVILIEVHFFVKDPISNMLQSVGVQRPGDVKAGPVVQHVEGEQSAVEVTQCVVDHVSLVFFSK
jgi:hypothetical protein